MSIERRFLAGFGQSFGKKTNLESPVTCKVLELHSLQGARI